MNRVYRILSDQGPYEIAKKINKSFPGRLIRYGEAFAPGGNHLYIHFDDGLDREEETFLILTFGANPCSLGGVVSTYLESFSDYASVKE